MEKSFPDYLGEHYPKTTTKASGKEDIYETSLSGTKHDMRCSSIFETKLPKVRKKAVWIAQSGNTRSKSTLKSLKQCP